jgi:hypothetical protein
MKSLLIELEKRFKHFEACDDEIDEANVTANLDGGAGPVKTPRAFSTKNEPSGSHVEVFDFKKSKTSKNHFEAMDMFERRIEEKINELTYRQYKKDDTVSPSKKVNIAIKDINRKLYELEILVNQNYKLKSEMGVDGKSYWKSTRERFSKISERMMKISNKLRDLSL